MSRRRVAILVATISALLAAAGLVYLDEVHTYAMRTETFEFTSNGNRLSGTLVLPQSQAPRGVVAFIHGDGPINADHDGGYLPIWERLAEAGYASISWDKPGAGESTGNWEHQSMSERAQEVVAAIDAIQDRQLIDSRHVGLIAFSQGGWPLPLVASQRDIDFVIAVSPAISWQRQGRYDLDIYLTGQDATPTQRAIAHDYSDDQRALIDTQANYSEYTDFVEDHRPTELERFDYFDTMSQDRWQFVLTNHSADATSSLPILQETPVLLQLGEHDIHVDVDDTEAVYQRVLGPDCLTVVRYPDAGHSMLKKDLEESTIALWIQALWQPRTIFADGVLNTIKAFADHHECTTQRDRNDPQGWR